LWRPWVFLSSLPQRTIAVENFTGGHAPFGGGHIESLCNYRLITFNSTTRFVIRQHASFWGDLNELFITPVETSGHRAKASRWRDDSMNLGDG
jgi:hypothetical protein